MRPSKNSSIASAASALCPSRLFPLPAVRDEHTRGGLASSFRLPPLERQVHPAGADRGDRPVLAPDQVLAVSTARTWRRSPRISRRTTSAVIVDEHVEPLTLDDAPDLVVIQVYITNAYRAYRIADHYRAPGRVRRARRTARHRRFPMKQPLTPTPSFSGPGEQTFPQFLADFRAGAPQRLYVDLGPHARPRPAHSPRSDSPHALPRAEFHRGHARLPAALRLLLQGRILSGRPRLLHAARRRCAGRDRPPARDAISISSTIICWATAASPQRSSTA